MTPAQIDAEFSHILWTNFSGQVNIYNYAGTTSVTVDIQGYFTSTSDEASSGGFSVMTPSRIANTAGWEYGDGVADQMLQVGQSLDIQAEGLAGIPADATALFVNVEIRNATTGGTTWIGAGGSTQTWPVSMEYDSSGPYSSGRTVPLDAQGRIRIKNLTGSSINIKVDVQGYFTAVAGQGASFTPITPTNVYSTTEPGETNIAGNTTRTVDIAGKAGIPAAGQAVAVALTVSVKNWTATGTVSLFPAGIAWPNNSTVAFVAGEGVPTNGSSATTISGLSDGKVAIRNNSTQPVSVTLTAQGWFSLINTTPDTPEQVSISPITAGIVTQTPTLDLLVSDVDAADTLQAEFAIYQGTTQVWTATSTPASSGTHAQVTVPAGVLSEGATYTVKARTTDGIATSAWTPTRTVATRAVAAGPPLIVQRYAPRVRLHPDEPWGPMSANTFINHSDLDFAWDGNCSDGDEMDTTPSQTALGDGGYRDKAKNSFPYCNDIGTWFYSNMLTRPWEEDNGTGTPGGDGFRLDLENSYRDGQGFTEPGGEPVYYRWVPGRHIVYWFHWGYSQTLNFWNHEGDWERIAIQLTSDNKPYEVEYFHHHDSCTLHWSQVPKIYNHPRVWAAKEAHGSWPAGANTFYATDNIASGGEVWATQLNLDRVVDMPWYGYGGGWGETGNGNNTSGPLGPSPFKKAPTFKAARCDMTEG